MIAQSERKPTFFKPAHIWIGLCTLLIAATLALWARNGTEVFAEMLIAGWTACFG